ncbi:YARHG domain-containing protein [Ekhidna sp.]|uniref:YARHG domain-containing protein n=1 Tax=Ekhidna sp. TaxID=2608089 RepID=UPI0032EDC29B
MRILSIAIISLLLFSCSDNQQKKQTAIEQKEIQQEPIQKEQIKEEVIELPEPNQNNIEYAQLDSTISEDIKNLDKTFISTPFYVNLKGRNFYIICTGKYNYKIERFNGTLKYGLANDSLTVLLEPEYDKIYNPNLTIEDCFEIERNSKIGLVNYRTGDILQPQFDCILPSSNEPNEIAYGLKDGQWFKIQNSEISLPVEIAFDPIPILRTLSFNIKNVGENMMFDSYWEYYEDDANEGRGVVLIPSYVSYLGLLDRDYTDIILPDQEGRIDFGTKEVRLSTSYKRSLSDKLVAFLVSAYESGIGARGYHREAKQLVVHNEATNSLYTTHLATLSESDYFCGEANYRFVNDSIIEVKVNSREYRNRAQRYEFETNFIYHKIEEDGSIKELKSIRYYDFTKFILIDESNFKGCFAWRISNASYSDEHNMWVADHLSIEDLDIMRNEIFAEYGYKFKSEKWQKYFSKQPWYTPKYDDVNDMLTEIDKANVKFILKIKEQMERNEDSFRNKRPTKYVAAG